MSISTPTRNNQQIPLWRDERFLKAAAQIVSAVVIIGLLYWGIANFLEITRQRGMPLTYGFLDDPAGFPITEYYIPYAPTMSFGRAFIVGLVNTIVVSAVGILWATLLGLFVGLARRHRVQGLVWNALAPRADQLPTSAVQELSSEARSIAATNLAFAAECRELKARFQRAELPRRVAGDILQELADLAINETKKKGQFVFPGIGKLVKAQRKARVGVNPKTKEKIKIPAKTVVKFRVAKVAKEAVSPSKK